MKLPRQMNQPNNKKGTPSLFLVFLILVQFVLVVSALPALAGNSQIISAGILKKIEGDVVGVRFFQGGKRVLVLAGKNLTLFDAASGGEIARHSFGISEHPLRLDLADISNDGNPEIAVTSFLSGRPSSYLIGYSDEAGFKVILGDIPYLFRAVGVGGGEFLAGQTSTQESPFAGAVHRLLLKGGRLKRGERLDLPKRIGIYQFASGGVEERMWVRDNDAKLRLYQKSGRKWKVAYKTSEKFRGNANCVLFLEEVVGTENREKRVCVPVPPQVSISGPGTESRITSIEYLIIDSHDYLLAGVMLRPNLPRKAYVNMLTYTDEGGLVSCKEWGPYQGWVGAYLSAAGCALPGAGCPKTGVFINSSGEYGKPRLSEIDIASVDCSADF